MVMTRRGMRAHQLASVTLMAYVDSIHGQTSMDMVLSRYCSECLHRAPLSALPSNPPLVDPKSCNITPFSTVTDHQVTTPENLNFSSLDLQNSNSPHQVLQNTNITVPTLPRPNFFKSTTFSTESDLQLTIPKTGNPIIHFELSKALSLQLHLSVYNQNASSPTLILQFQTSKILLFEFYPSSVEPDPQLQNPRTLKTQ